MGLMKKEEKLLKRLFQKRRNELQAYITHTIQTMEKVESKAKLADSLTLTLIRHQKELFELNHLEKKVFAEVYKFEATNDTCNAT